MEKINIGQEVELQFGGRARVSGVIGAGSHDTVYLAEYNGMKWALKWYDTDKITDLDRFRSNIKNNMADGAPNNKFLWPRYFTKETEKGSFGIMLECKPDSFEPMRDLLRGYKKIIEPDTGKITKKKVRFSSLHAMVTAGINIIHGFRQLHRFGKCYHQMSRNSFFINPDTGAVLIGGCDNIAPVGSELVHVAGQDGGVIGDHEVLSGVFVEKSDFLHFAILPFLMVLFGAFWCFTDRTPACLRPRATGSSRHSCCIASEAHFFCVVASLASSRAGPRMLCAPSSPPSLRIAS